MTFLAHGQSSKPIKHVGEANMGKFASEAILSVFLGLPARSPSHSAPVALSTFQLHFPTIY